MDSSIITVSTTRSTERRRDHGGPTVTTTTMTMAPTDPPAGSSFDVDYSSSHHGGGHGEELLLGRREEQRAQGRRPLMSMSTTTTTTSTTEAPPSSVAAVPNDHHAGQGRIDCPWGKKVDDPHRFEIAMIVEPSPTPSSDGIDFDYSSAADGELPRRPAISAVLSAAAASVPPPPSSSVVDEERERKNHADIEARQGIDSYVHLGDAPTGNPCDDTHRSNSKNSPIIMTTQNMNIETSLTTTTMTIGDDGNDDACDGESSSSAPTLITDHERSDSLIYLPTPPLDTTAAPINSSSSSRRPINDNNNGSTMMELAASSSSEIFTDIGATPASSPVQEFGGEGERAATASSNLEDADATTTAFEKDGEEIIATMAAAEEEREGDSAATTTTAPSSPPSGSSPASSREETGAVVVAPEGGGEEDASESSTAPPPAAIVVDAESPPGEPRRDPAASVSPKTEDLARARKDEEGEAIALASSSAESVGDAMMELRHPRPSAISNPNATMADAAAEEDELRPRQPCQLQKQPSGTHINSKEIEEEEERAADVADDNIVDKATGGNRDDDASIEMSTSVVPTSPHPAMEDNEEDAGRHAAMTTTLLDVLQTPVGPSSRSSAAIVRRPSSPNPKTPYPTPNDRRGRRSSQRPTGHSPPPPPMYRTMQHPLHHQQHQQQQTTPTQQRPGRRSISLRLLEEIPQQSRPRTQKYSSPLISSVKGINTPFRSLRRFRSLSLSNGKAFSLSVTDDGGSTTNNNGGGAGGLEALDEKTPSPVAAALKRGGADGNDGGGEGSTADRGTITVSWYEGTTSAEMTEHVFNCVLRKLNSSSGGDGSKKGGGGRRKLEDVRLLDENAGGDEEVVLCPYLPDGSRFLLKFRTSLERPATPPPKVNHRSSSSLNPYAGKPFVSTAPDSPSAEPSPFPSSADLPSLAGKHGVLNGGVGNGTGAMHDRISAQQQQLQTQHMLSAVAALLQQQATGGGGGGNGRSQLNRLSAQLANNGGVVVPPPGIPPFADVGYPDAAVAAPRRKSVEEKKEELEEEAGTTTHRAGDGGAPSPMKTIMAPVEENATGAPTTDQLIERQLRQLNELFTQRRSGTSPSNANDVANASEATAQQHRRDDDHTWHRDEKKQVIFVIANYLVLFLSLIALSAEIQSRLPRWMDKVQQNYDSVQNCATDRDALMECLVDGDFSGLVASFLLWATQSAAAKRIFLFGFDTPKKLWTVVYEALVTAVCWGTSYLFIRRGLNPNTRQNFLHKYWKDAVYGSLAGFNAAFMKAVLKNLIPQDVALEALEGGRQLRIFHWLGALIMADEG